MVDEALLPALVAEAARKSDVCWVSYTAESATVQDRLVWHVWQADSFLLVVGGEEQDVPGLASADRAQVTLRSRDSGGRLVTCPCAVRRVLPEDPDWDEATTSLVAGRLNLLDPATAPARWAADSVVLRLTPSTQPE